MDAGERTFEVARLAAGDDPAFGVVKTVEKRRPDGVASPADIEWLRRLPPADIIKLRETLRKDVWEACFAEKVFASCVAACAKSARCTAPRGWDLCLRLYHDEPYCLERCWERRDCEAPAAVVRQQCAADPGKPYCGQ